MSQSDPMSIKQMKLVLDNLGLAVWHANRLSRFADYDDLYQAACIGLMQAARTHDGRTPFASWATFKIRGEIAEEIRRQRRITWDVPKGSLLARGSLAEYNPVMEPDLTIEDTECVAHLLSKLPPKTRRIVELHFGLVDGEQWTVRRIGEAVGMSHQLVLYRIRVALRFLKGRGSNC